MALGIKEDRKVEMTRVINRKHTVWASLKCGARGKDGPGVGGNRELRTSIVACLELKDKSRSTRWFKRSGDSKWN